MSIVVRRAGGPDSWLGARGDALGRDKESNIRYMR
jgi:hypothetical protein